MKVLFGKNIGFSLSFMKLLEDSGDYDYYAFSDQDDVWLPNKLISAVNILCKLDNNLPNTYCSNCKVVDEKLNFIQMLRNEEWVMPNKKGAWFNSIAYGCTIVFNKQLKLEVRKAIHIDSIVTMCQHDYLVPIVSMYLGNIIYDNNSYILYRQTGHNAIGYKPNLKQQIRIRMKRCKNKDYYKNLIESFFLLYKDFMNREDKQTLIKIFEYKNNIKYWIRLLFDRDIAKNTIKGTIFLKANILFRRF